MKARKTQLVIFSVIFFCLFIAFTPVILSNNYIRQDDLMWEIWPNMKMSDFGYLYYNTVYQLVRPICMVSFYLTDLISINIQGAVYVRLMSIMLLGILGILLYLWQLLFNTNRLLAATFAICSFTLPAYQIFAATGNYSLILTALVFTIISAFFWYHAVSAFDNKKKYTYYFLGSLFFFASLLDYPLSSMYIWVLLTICYLNLLYNHDLNKAFKQRFFYVAAFNTIFMMGFYFIFCKIFHLLFSVDLSNGRSTVVDTTHLFSRFMRIFDVLGWHSNLWLWSDVNPLIHTPLFAFLSIGITALILLNIKNGITHKVDILIHAVQTLGMVFILFFLSYSPIMATPELQITFRYALTTMPILLYLLLWSITEIIRFCAMRNAILKTILNTICAIAFISMTAFGMAYANLMLADGVVGPHTHDFEFIQQQLNDKVIPLLKQHKRVAIHAIACDEGPMNYAANIPVSLEYGMRICQFQQQVIGVIIHSLNKMGYPSNYSTHNNVVYGTNEIAVKDTPWGALIVNSPSNSKNSLKPYIDNNMQVVTIDTRTMQPYQRFEFYKQVWAKLF